MIIFTFVSGSINWLSPSVSHNVSVRMKMMLVFDRRTSAVNPARVYMYDQDGVEAYSSRCTGRRQRERNRLVLRIAFFCLTVPRTPFHASHEETFPSCNNDEQERTLIIFSVRRCSVPCHKSISSLFLMPSSSGRLLF
jgi:hypothetical protein